MTRGNHYHDSKVERFMVVDGSAIIRLRPLGGASIEVLEVTGEQVTVVTIPPGVTHSIENPGPRELLTIFWADEVFDPERPDTHPEDVLRSEESS